jgi:hypothetical protein
VQPLVQDEFGHKMPRIVDIYMPDLAVLFVETFNSVSEAKK